MNFTVIYRELKNYPISGICSGLFAVHVLYRASKKRTYDATQNIIFSALCVLYVLCVSIIVLDTVAFVVTIFVSNIKI